MSVSCSDVCELAGDMMLAAGFKLPSFNKDWYSEEHWALIEQMRKAHVYQEARPKVTVRVDVQKPWSAQLWVKINESQILYAVMDPRIVDQHWPSNKKRKKRKDCAVRTYWGPYYVSGDKDRSQSILNN